MTAPAPVFRGQANAFFRTDKQNRSYARGQEVPYNVNGAPPATTAGAVSFTPTGGLSSTDVQAALAEVDAEKDILRVVQAYSGSIAANAKLVTVDATAGPITIALPSAASAANRTISFKKIDASANAVTLDPNGAEAIDGAATKVLAAQWDSLTITSNGTAWFIT